MAESIKLSKENSYDLELGKEFLHAILKSIKEKLNKLDLIKLKTSLEESPLRKVKDKPYIKIKYSQIIHLIKTMFQSICHTI